MAEKKFDIPATANDVANLPLAAAMAAVSGIKGMLEELEPTIGKDGVERVKVIMRDRLAQFPLSERVRSVVAGELG